MTEDEAKTKWCPFARQMVSIDEEMSGRKSPVAIASANRFDVNKMSICLGSGCMAWRETHPASDPLRHTDGSLTYANSAKGFCGLAGTPAQ